MENMKTRDRAREYFYISPDKSCLVQKIGQWKWVLAIAA